ncbi:MULTISPECIES: type 1 glutamine amidotransferase domain-containing protein [unclassified Halomonas]|uniref:type 1 glutamine amidotransferase domain-containing protein n=1 Tax=unclassified Halomonas TaxID=2609666 RepID=UPI001C98C432|nr:MULTISPECIES: type 1 glutamine amidotransferase domain-containing protein [unclassified Halomonas]MBY5926728.1 type 1 glutamine amidotransferase [Halomonas sp. DP4Y7-2]MBY6233770.1 type 1 glutamine amidotransferase [Halomonas sp. DP4Y7-1]
MTQQVEGKRVAILATHGFEESELAVPKAKLQQQGIVVHVVSPEAKGIRAWAESDWGDTYGVDVALEDASEHDYHALVLPGGLFNPDALRLDEAALAFVRAFFQAGKPVAAICHASWILINADVVSGRKLTSYPSVAQDLRNAGAEWVDQQVVVDNGLVTSRKPDDLDIFCHKLVEEIGEGRHAKHA